MPLQSTDFSFSSRFTGIKVTIISPCTPKHIEKYKADKLAIIQETPAAFHRITVPQLIQPKLSLDVMH